MPSLRLGADAALLLHLLPFSVTAQSLSCFRSRVGNLAWVHEYNKALPDTWAVIHREVRGGKAAR